MSMVAYTYNVCMLAWWKHEEFLGDEWFSGW